MKIRKIMKSIACCGLTIGLLAADIPLSYIALDNISLTKTTVLAAEELTYYDVGAYYNYYVDNNAVYITSVMVSDSIITVPSTIDEMDVIALCDRAFFGSASLLDVTLPDTIKTIGNEAFANCYKLAQVELPNGVTTIGDNIFMNCHTLSSVYVPDTVTSVGSKLLINSPYAVVYCNSGSYIDNYCTNAQYNAQPVSKYVRYQGMKTFASDYMLLCSDTTSTIVSYYAKREQDALPAGDIYDKEITAIAPYALSYNSNIKELDIADTITSVGAGALSHCDKLIKVTLSDGQSTIPASCFKGDSKLETVDGGKTLTTVEDNAFTGCNQLSKLTLESTVESIGDAEFADCANLTILGRLNSYAYRYAINHSIIFEELSNLYL